MPDITKQTVTGRWSYVIADGFAHTVDPDLEPDEVGPDGIVVFTAQIGGNPSLPAGTGTDKRDVALGQMRGLVADGELQDLNGETGIRMPTKIGDNPVYWTAQPILKYGSTSIKARTITFGPTEDPEAAIHLNDILDPGDYPELSDTVMQELLAKYTKPATGIPEDDLAPEVRDQLGGATTVEALTDAGAVGKQVVQSTTSAAARTAIGALSQEDADAAYVRLEDYTPGGGGISLTDDGTGLFTIDESTTGLTEDGDTGLFLIGA